MNDASGNPVEELARELWEAHAGHAEGGAPTPGQPWDKLETKAQNHWRMLARVALSYASGAGRAQR